MKNLILICFLLSFNTVLLGQEKTKPFKDGEWLKYKMSYSGFFKAGTAELTLKETDLNGKKVFHAKGFGKTSDFIGWFFKVRDTYQSYFDYTKVSHIYLREMLTKEVILSKGIFDLIKTQK